MTRHNFQITATALAIALGLGAVGATSAMADTNGGDKAEVQAFMAAPMSIADAITAAESGTGGKAMSAEFDNEDIATGMYHVEVAMADGTTKEIGVNPADGSVTALVDDDSGAKGDGDGDGDGETDDDADSDSN